MSEVYSDVSVSIVTYNNADVIKEKLIRLLQIFKFGKVSNVFIVDSASTDQTAKIIDSMANQEPLIVPILLSENKGFGYGHNQAIALSNSKYHIVMNLDALPKTNSTLDEMIAYLDHSPKIDLLSPLVRYPDGSIQYLTRSEPTVFDLGIRFLGDNVFRNRQESFIHLSDGYDHEQIIYNATGSFMFFRLQTLKKIGGFDERYFLYMEDTDITKKINQDGLAIFSPNFEIIHEWQRGNHTLSGAKLMIRSVCQYFNKWGWKLF